MDGCTCARIVHGAVGTEFMNHCNCRSSIRVEEDGIYFVQCAPDKLQHAMLVDCLSGSNLQEFILIRSALLHVFHKKWGTCQCLGTAPWGMLQM